MFTGIVEEVGKVKRVVSGSTDGELQISAKKVLEGTKIGDSIAVNGVCLTVTKLYNDGFVANVMPETLRRTNLGELHIGDLVDLERAMAADGRFGGHIVSGHIDGVGTICEVKNEGNAVWVRIKAEQCILNLIVEKGSITIDGISLTIATICDTDFQVSLIPHTAKETILLRKGVGAKVNLENDIVGKYVQKLMNIQVVDEKKESKITMEFLAANGF